jgi:putative PIN family toxin of toxin-antitoxin system
VRLVLDTNVLLAGFATHGLCEALLKIVYRDHIVIVSEHILDEVSRHFSGKFKTTKAQTESVVAFLRSSSEIVEPVAVPRGTLRDKDDLPVLGTAVAGDAACLVTGDQELLALGRFQAVDILSPRAFYDRLRG